MKQLSVVRDFGSPWEDCLKGDPVRPHIPAIQRTAHNREYFVLHDDNRVAAVTCVAYIDFAPKDEAAIFQYDHMYFNVACFYTVWSNERGCGREVINRSLRHNAVMRKHVKLACTLSPKTEMARQFHLSNGATLFRENELTDNYVYDISRL